MNLLQIFRRFPDQESCIEHLEKIRYGDTPYCPHCGSSHVARKADTDRIGRWNCHDCKSSFNVLSGTIFEKTQVPLQKWFMAIGLVINAKKSLSSCQLARDLELNQKTAWYMQQRIRAEMSSKQNEIRLQGIIKADEIYVGGKSRKANERTNRNDDYHNPSSGKSGKTKKVPVLGAVERSGNVVAKLASNVSSKSILGFIKDFVEPTGSVLITDEFRSYSAVRNTMRHAVIRHQECYVEGVTHTNTIEGFWALIKRSWYESHHHYKKEYIPLYLCETAWKYNNREKDNDFGSFMQGCFA